MVLTRRMAKLQAASHGDSNASDNAAAITANGPAQAHTVVCEDGAQEVADLSVPTHGNGDEGSDAPLIHIFIEDESTSTGPCSVVSNNAENTEGASTYRGQQEDHAEAQPQTRPSATQSDGHFLEIPHTQTVSTQNESHGEYHFSPPASALPSPTTRKSRKRKGTRTHWSRTKGQKAKAKGKASEPTHNAKATGSTNPVADTAEQCVPIEERPMKCLPQRAAKTAEIIEAVRKAEATVRKGKRKANPDQLPTTREAPTGSKRARNERPFDVGDNMYLRVDPGPSRTTRRIRQRTVAPPSPEYPVPVEAPSARRLRRRRVNLPAQPLRNALNKRKACIFDLVDEDRITKRRKLDPDSSPRQSASDLVAIEFGPPPHFEPSDLPLEQIKREYSTPAPLEPSPPASSSSPARGPPHDACPKPPYVEGGEDDDEMKDVEDALDVADPEYGGVDLGWVLARLARRLDKEKRLPPRTTTDPAKIGTQAIGANNGSMSVPVTSQPSRVLSSTRHRQQLLIGVFERLPVGPCSQTGTIAMPTSSVIPAPPPVPYHPPAPVRPAPRVDLRRLVRTLTPGPCPDWFAATPHISGDGSRASSSESSFHPTPSSSPSASRFTSRSSSRSRTNSPDRSLPPLRERSMAPEPSDGLIEALRAGRVSMCPSPSPTERDTEE